MDRLWNRNYIKVMIANFSLFFAFYVLTPLLPLYLSEHFGATKDVIGLVLSGYTITALLCRPFSGYIVDSFSRKTVLMVCFGTFAIFFAGYLAASTLLLFTIVRTLHGGPFGALTVSNSTVAIDVLPSSRRTEGIGYYGLSNNLAMAIAPTVGIFIYKFTASFEFLFWLALIVACLGWLVDATVELSRKEERGTRKENTPAADTTLPGNLIVSSSSAVGSWVSTWWPSVSVSACSATTSPSTARRSWASPAARAPTSCSVPSG